jgi:transcriptional regulator with XRE-family HTH domain
MKSCSAKSGYRPGSSRGRPSLDTLIAEMAKALQDEESPAARLRELRGKKTQPVIADAVDVSLRAYQEWEAGGGISWAKLAKLAEYYGVSEEYILYGPEGSRPPQTQMDRMEQKLDAILEALGVDDDEAATRSVSDALDASDQLHDDSGTASEGTPGEEGEEGRAL